MASLWIERVDPEAGGLVVLRLEGVLAGETLAALDEVCRVLLDGVGALALDLSGVTYVSPSGLTLLATLRAAGAELRDGSPLLQDLLRETPPQTLRR